MKWINCHLKFTGAVEVISSGLTPFVVDRLGRKIILLFSAAGMCISIVSKMILIDHYEF